MSSKCKKCNKRGGANEPTYTENDIVLYNNQMCKIIGGEYYTHPRQNQGQPYLRYRLIVCGKKHEHIVDELHNFNGMTFWKHNEKNDFMKLFKNK